MKVSSEEKAKTFDNELNLIFDSKVREFTKLCTIAAPDYIFIDCPAATSGKYHPLDELGPDGIVIHTKKVVTMAYEMVKGMDCENNRDLVVAAAIIHDLRKKGPKNRGALHTLHNHPAHGANLIEEVQEATQLLSDVQYNIIRNSVGYHYGPWSNSPWKKPINTYTREELALYVSDFVVSKRFIHTDYRR